MPNETYVTYWRVQVPVNLSIVDLETNEILYQEDIVLGNLITCRYPLLEQITYEYEDRLTSTGPLMMETTGEHSSEGSPGFGVLTVALSIVLMVLWMRRK